MSEARIPAKLAAFAERNMPDLGGCGEVVIHCGARLPFDWLPGDRHCYCGMTLWNTIHLRSPVTLDEDDDALVLLLLHELVHVEQFRAQPFLFPIKYVWGLMRYGYADHPSEIEARDRSDVLLAQYRAG